MLGLAKRRSLCPEGQGLLPVQHARALLIKHDATVARIHAMVGVPAKHWQLLYEGLFAAFAEYVQEIPARSTFDHVGSRTILRHALETVEVALKIRRGYVLPPGREPEAVANKQDVWTYAVVLAAWLRNTGEALLEQRVTLHDRVRRPMEVWIPWAGPMNQSGGAFYRVDSCPSTATDLAQLGLPLLVAHVVPVDGLRWLAAHEDALVACLHTLGGFAPGASVIREIVSRTMHPSDAKSAPEDLESPLENNLNSDRGTAAPPAKSTRQEFPTPTVEPRTAVAEREGKDVSRLGTDEADGQRTAATGDHQARDSGEAFLEWLRNGIRSGVLTVNAPKGHLHMVEAGLLLASPGVFRAFAGDNWREVQKRFLKRRLTERTPNGENIFYYQLCDDRVRETVKGVLIRNPHEKLGVSLPAADSRLVPKRG